MPRVQDVSIQHKVLPEMRDKNGQSGICSQTLEASSIDQGEGLGEKETMTKHTDAQFKVIMEELKDSTEQVRELEARIKELEAENERLWAIVNAAVPYVEDPR